MGSTEAFAAALDDGDYAKALAAYRTTDHARTSVGKATEAFLLSLTGDHAGAARQLTGVAEAELVEVIVRGERERAARWTDVEAAGALTSSEPLPHLGVYAGTAVALLQDDKALLEGAIARDKAKIPPVAGKLVFRDGTAREFSSIVDSDDGIGAMLETYGPSGLMYFPFAALRSVTFLPPRNFIDRLVPRADVVLADGTRATVLVPLLYALSSTSGDAMLRAGRLTSWRYVGPARRGLGQRDFVLDGGRMIGMQNVGAIELRGVATASTSASPGGRAPLPRARVEAHDAPTTSSRNLMLIGLVLAVIVAVLFIVMS
ncbi:MAG: hypothetical protein F9K40_02825 [Kofleriaceae bacterium]|nr:MAG: hypothetical protein F9K40_02825 [Kofleriaceae bacterium]